MEKILVLIAVGVLILGFSGTSAAFDDNGNPLLVFTENSFTDLTARIGGVDVGVVTNLGPDRWEWDPPIPPGKTVSELGAASAAWKEPEYSISQHLVNITGFASSPAIGFLLESDIDSGSEIFPFLLENGGTQPTGLLLTFQDGTGINYDVQFIDNGDAGAVPEPSTMILLGSGLLGLWGARKKFFKK